jgi:hypothetical protein
MKGAFVILQANMIARSRAQADEYEADIRASVELKSQRRPCDHERSG